MGKVRPHLRNGKPVRGHSRKTDQFDASSSGASSQRATETSIAAAQAETEAMPTGPRTERIAAAALGAEAEIWEIHPSQAGEGDVVVWPSGYVEEVASSELDTSAFGSPAHGQRQLIGTDGQRIIGYWDHRPHGDYCKVFSRRPPPIQEKRRGPVPDGWPKRISLDP